MDLSCLRADHVLKAVRVAPVILLLLLWKVTTDLIFGYDLLEVDRPMCLHP